MTKRHSKRAVTPCVTGVHADYENGCWFECCSGLRRTRDLLPLPQCNVRCMTQGSSSGANTHIDSASAPRSAPPAEKDRTGPTRDRKPARGACDRSARGTASLSDDVRTKRTWTAHRRLPELSHRSNGLIEMRSQPPPPKVNSGQWGGPERRQGVRDRAGNGPEGIEAQGFWLRRTQNPSRLCTEAGGRITRPATDHRA